MRIGCVLIVCFMFSSGDGQDLSTSKQDRPAVAAYLNRLAKNDNAYFYALYVTGSFIRLTGGLSDSRRYSSLSELTGFARAALIT